MSPPHHKSIYCTIMNSECLIGAGNMNILSLCLQMNAVMTFLLFNKDRSEYYCDAKDATFLGR